MRLDQLCSAVKSTNLESWPLEKRLFWRLSTLVFFLLRRVFPIKVETLMSLSVSDESPRQRHRARYLFTFTKSDKSLPHAVLRKVVK